MKTERQHGWVRGARQLLLALLLDPAKALACPDCQLARAARATLLRDDLATPLLAAALPFLLILTLCFLLELAAARRT